MKFSQIVFTPIQKIQNVQYSRNSKVDFFFWQKIYMQLFDFQLTQFYNEKSCGKSSRLRHAI